MSLFIALSRIYQLRSSEETPTPQQNARPMHVMLFNYKWKVETHTVFSEIHEYLENLVEL